MKIYSAIAKRGKLKYYDEHIDFTLDGTPDYNWKKINSQKIKGEELSIPNELLFTPAKAKFEELDNYDWLKSTFALPVLNNTFIKILKNNLKQKYEIYPVIIRNKKGNINLNFSAFYLKEYFDCLDRENSTLTKIPDYEYFEFKNCYFKKKYRISTIF
ncbi:hypothetical protein I2486_00590 [Cellulophaga sp. E16_2]|uniref:hypothetical protein n=1 Tax=Cellulophaga sp. E16_2 TaxID=2789297 RepID=UPI001A919475|nr:hypothetical protein [Cellulophaga sp. E16_2]MBO0589894.1 hypothetical protein [Cellulophaga sp. E16_2]